MNPKFTSFQLFKVFLLFLFCITILSCSKKAEKQAITTTFNKIISFDTKGSISDYIDQESMSYFSEIVALAPEGSLTAKSTFISKYPEYPLTTAVIMEVVEQFLPDSAPEDKAKTGFFAAQLIGAVPLNFDVKDKYSIYEFKKIGRDKAVVAVRIKASEKAYILSEYYFNKEEDKWKLNVPSTFKLGEKMLGAKWKSLGGDEQTFAALYLQQLGGENSFRIKSKSYFTDKK